MEGRPDYVPRNWKSGRFDHWAAARPQRVVGFFLVLGLVIAGLATWAITDPGDYFSSMRGYMIFLLVPLYLIQAGIYVPRAIRASRRRD